MDFGVFSWARIYNGFYSFRKRYQAYLKKIPKGETMNYQNYINNE
ncbi:uncharacterized protein METZ01_LOCUS127188, partial [marine metagenome]